MSFGEKAPPNDEEERLARAIRRLIEGVDELHRKIVREPAQINRGDEMNVKTGIREGGQPVRIIHCHGCGYVVLQQHRLECPRPKCGHVNSPDQVIVNEQCIKCHEEVEDWTLEAGLEYGRAS